MAENDEQKARAETQRKKQAQDLADYEARRKAKIPDPGGYILGGFGLQVVAGVVMALGLNAEDGSIAILIGAGVAFIGSVLILLGIIAHGVVMGMRIYHYDRAIADRDSSA
jgi:hypothetical protein